MARWSQIQPSLLERLFPDLSPRRRRMLAAAVIGWGCGQLLVMIGLLAWWSSTVPVPSGNTGLWGHEIVETLKELLP
jgi:hypothetical protein